MQAFVIDTFAFCQNQERREGKALVADFLRLSNECSTQDGELIWSLTGGVDRLGQAKLHLIVTGHVSKMLNRIWICCGFAIRSDFS
jgi:uncharacterized protein